MPRPADTLDVAGQRGAVDRVLACLEGREAIAESLSHNSAVTVPEACREIADVLVQEVAQSDDFHSVTNPLLGLWDVAPLAVSPAPGAPAMRAASPMGGRGVQCSPRGTWGVAVEILSLRPVHYTAQASR